MELESKSPLNRIRKLLAEDMTARAFIIAFAAAAATKLLLCGCLMTTVYSGSAPIDDELMLRAARSIAAGNWLGAYSWDAMAKHMFFAVWLRWLNALSIPYLLGGQLLYLAASAVAMQAAKPVAKKRVSRLLIFLILWFSPYSTAAFTLRVYIDNIYPSLCLLCFAGVVGACLRFNEGFKELMPYSAAAGVGLGLAWLTKDDAVWLLPFALCAGLCFVIFSLCRKDGIKKKLPRLLSALLAAALFFGCTGAYKAMNQKYYGRSIISDYTSAEFKDAIGALVRADTDAPHAGVLICRETREKLSAVSPLMKELCDELDNGYYYNGYSFGEQDDDFNSAGVIWMVRKAAFNAGLADTPEKARDFYAELANEINAACDGGLIECREPTLLSGLSATLVPFDECYLVPTVTELGNSLRVLLAFEQTSSLPELSVVTAEEAADWRSFTHSPVFRSAIVNSHYPSYYPWQLAAEAVFAALAFIYRCGVLFALYFAFKTLLSDARYFFKEKRVSLKGMRGILLLGLLLSALLRVTMISYIEVSSFLIGTYLLYLAPAGAAMLLFLAVGTAAKVEGVK